MPENLLGRSVRRDVSKVHGAAGARDDAGAHGHRRSGLHVHLHASHIVERSRRRLGRVELGRAIGRGRNNRLVHLGRDALLDRTRSAILLLEVLMLGLLEAAQILELGAGERGRSSGLEWAAEEQLGGKQRGELHIKARSRGGQIGAIVVRAGLVGNRLRVDGGNVSTARVSVGKPRDVGSEGTMREASVAVGGLGRVTKATLDVAVIVAVRPLLGTRDILHPEKMRGDKTVPTDVR